MEPFTLRYFAVLAVAVLYILALLYFGSMRSTEGRKKMLGILCYSLVIWEGMNQVWLLLSGHYTPVEHLPLHLCGLMIFMIPLWWKTKNEFLENFIYYAGLFGASMALLFNYHKAPVFNFQTFQTFGVHATIFAIPLFNTLLLGFRPKRKYYVKCLQLLVLIAAGLYGVNTLLGSNYMFLMKSSLGSPLELFEAWVGYPWSLAIAAVLIFGLWFLMMIFFDKKERNEQMFVVSQEYVDRNKRWIR